ncbi:hypothetical protein [Clostridium sp.]
MGKNLYNHNTDEKAESLKKEIESVKDKSLIGAIFEFILDIITFWR